MIRRSGRRARGRFPVRHDGGVYVVVTGPPASGKSTLSRAIADDLALPLLAKDTLKAALVESLGAEDVAASRRLGRAAVQALLAVAREAGSGVLDSVWVDRERARRELAGLGKPLVEVFCRCDVETMRGRYAGRASEGAGRFDLERREVELWPEEALRPLAGPWPVVEVDTAERVDVHDVTRRMRDQGWGMMGHP